MKNSLSSYLFLSLILFFTSTSVIYSETLKCNPNDRKVLLQIKAGLGNPYTIVSWGTKSVPDCCDWNGIECDYKPPYRVVKLYITQAEITAQIPAAIGDLPYLERIMFHHIDNLTGTIPSSITKLTNLISLDITNTNLSGPIPIFLTKLKNLSSLSLSFNGFTGSIPPGFSQLRKLEDIDLSRNKLTGTIPETFGHFSGSLKYLFLSHNQLTGTIPKSLGNLNLTFVDFSRNKLTGDASFLFGKNKTVQRVDISRNNLKFDLSKVEFSESFQSGSIDLNHNNIFGRIPQQLTQIPTLQLLNVSYNRLCGPIPQGGRLQDFDMYSYFHNRCLCGPPLPPC